MISGVLTELIEIVFTERKGKPVGGDFISSLTSVLDGLVLGNGMYFTCESIKHAYQSNSFIA